MDDGRDPLTGEIIGAAIAVSKHWGSAVLESVYKKSLAHELKKRGLSVAVELSIPGTYDTLLFDVAFRADMIVNHAVIVEAKAVAAILPVHRNQLITYLRLTGLRTGVLINFHAYPFTKGLVRVSL